MPSRSSLHAAAHILAVLCIAVSSAGTTAARSIVQPDPQAIEHAPVEAEPGHTASLTPYEPFGLTRAGTDSLARTWRRLQPAVQLEANLLGVCRTNPAVCTPAAARLLAVIDLARVREGRARIGAVNRAVNLAIRPQFDPARFGVTDVWSTPLMTFDAGVGDCEDYAIVKYLVLRAAGMADEDLRLVILHDHRVRQDHAVVAARVDGEWLILDNRRMVLLADTQMDRVTPLVSLAGSTETPHVVAAQQRSAIEALASR
jgi:predicted transglutaminase-like cysteine proteinase